MSAMVAGDGWTVVPSFSRSASAFAFTCSISIVTTAQWCTATRKRIVIELMTSDKASREGSE